jgi:orotate phosphoribosyltransferase
MISDSDSALKVAEFLLKIKAVRLSPEDPFTWASGWKSPIYCDNRVTLSYPNVRTFIRQEFVKLIKSKYNSIDAIVGVATGGIAMGALIAEEMGLPFAYVRSNTKGHGMQNRLEGRLEANDKVVVIEDLISTGGSSLSAVEALENNGIDVLGMVAIFTYGFDISRKNFEEKDVELSTLSDYNALLAEAHRSEFISAEQHESLSKWRNAPDKWNIAESNAK